METEQTGNSWFFLIIVGLGLLAFGAHAYFSQKNRPDVRSGPISVAAVRGSEESGPAPAANPNVVVGYVQNLQEDVSIAQNKVDKYNAAAAARSKAIAAGNSEQ